MIRSIDLVERGRAGQADDRDPGDHDLVQAPVAELDDRVDHLLLLGLEDALLAAALDDQLELLGGHLGLARHLHPEQPGDPVRDPGQEPHDRAEDPGDPLDRAGDEHRQALGVGQPDRLGHELAQDDREEGQQDRHDQEGQAFRLVGEGRDRAQRLGQLVAQVDRGVGRGEEAQDGQAELDDGQEAAGVVLEALDPAGPPVALFGQLVEPAPPDRDDRDLGRHEEALEDRQDDDDQERREVGHPSGGSSGSGRGSRSRAGTPTASLPAGTSRLTTAPAPVRAPAPISTGAIEHRVHPDEGVLADRRPLLAPAVVVGRDRARPDVRPGADRGVAQVAHVVLLDARRRGGCS